MSITAPYPGIAGAILAGGAATRYGGVAKGMLSLPTGKPMTGRIIDQITEAGIRPIVIIANERRPYESCGCLVLPDAVPGQGPLGGIATALSHFEASRGAVLFMPCDLPGIMASHVTALCEAFEQGDAPIVAARTDESTLHPLCAVVKVDQRPVIEERANQPENRRVRRVWRELGAQMVDFADATAFHNVNSPEEMAKWRAISDVR